MHFLSNMTDIQLAASRHLKEKASNIYYQETTSKMRLSKPQKPVFKKLMRGFCPNMYIIQGFGTSYSNPFLKTSISGVVNQPPSHQPGVQLIKGIPTKGITTAVAQFLERNRGDIPE